MFEILNKDDSDKELDEMFKESNKKSNKELIETISPKNDQNTTNWYDKNKFNEILTTIDNNNFNHKNEIGKFKFNDINNLIKNIKNNAISEADIKRKINKLNERKNIEKKDKRLIKYQEKSLSLFDDLKTIFNNNNNNESDSGNENENESFTKMRRKMRMKMKVKMKVMMNNTITQNKQIIILKRLTKQNHLKIKQTY